MRRLFFLVTALISFLFIINGVFLRRTASFLLCGLLSFNSTSCYSFLDKYVANKATAASSSSFVTPLKENVMIKEGSSNQDVDKKGNTRNINYTERDKDIIIADQICIPFTSICTDIPYGNIILQPIISALAQAMNENAPITSSANNIFPVVGVLPGSPFEPNRSLSSVYTQLTKKESDGNVILKPGDYAIPMLLYCMKHSATSPVGHYYYLAPLKGSRAKMITTLNTRAIGSNIPHNEIQILSWNIQAGLSYQGMSEANRATIDSLIPEYRSELEGDFLDQLESTVNGLGILGLPSFDVLLSKLGDVGESIMAYKSFRSSLKQSGNFSQLTQQIILPGGTSTGGSLEDTPWSQINDQVYGRLLVKSNVGGPGVLQLRVLPKNIGFKQDSKTSLYASSIPITNLVADSSDASFVPITNLVADPKNSNIQPISFTPFCETSSNSIQTNMYDKDIIIAYNKAYNKTTLLAQNTTNSICDTSDYELVITNPSEDWTQSYPITESPAMPRITVTAELHNKKIQQPSIDSQNINFKWSLKIGGYAVNRGAEWVSYDFLIKDNVTGLRPWTPDFTKSTPSIKGGIVGGWGKLTVEATVNKETITSTPRWVNLSGTNPTKDAISKYIDKDAIFTCIDKKGAIFTCIDSSDVSYKKTLAVSYKETFKKIICNESHFQQFDKNPNKKNEPQDDRVDPKDKTPLPYRPLYGYPAGIGLTQLDPASFPAQQWNWKINVNGGIATYEEKAEKARNWRDREQERLDNEYKKVNDFIVNQGFKLDKKTTKIEIPQLTSDQLNRETIRLYNGGHQYHFDAHYIARKIDEQLKTAGIDVIGGKNWIEERIKGKTVGGRWSPTIGEIKINDWEQKPEEWEFPKAKDKHGNVTIVGQGYVEEVEGCSK